MSAGNRIQASTTSPAGEAPTEKPPPPRDTAPVGGGGQSQLVRVTVNLTPRSYAELVKLSESTGLGKTDVINRSLQIYALVNELLDRDNGSLVIKHPDGEQERIYIL